MIHVTAMCGIFLTLRFYSDNKHVLLRNFFREGKLVKSVPYFLVKSSSVTGVWLLL